MNVQLSRPHYQALLRLAAFHARRPDEAEDLLHDALIAAIAQGRRPWQEGLAWFRGVLRQQSAMAARGAVRRRRREALAVVPDHAEPAALPEPWRAVTVLPGGLRIVALLILTGHNRAEICHLLRITDETLRQRVCALKRKLGGAQAGEPLAEFTKLDGGLAAGALRRALLPVVRLGGASFGSYDPDGHLFAVKIVGRAPHKTPAGGN
jgi:DNA-directed RNA polymerase specialized sigma24 family protein